MPATYVLNRSKDHDHFLLRNQYSENVKSKFILKKNIQRKQGILLVDQIPNKDRLIEYSREGYRVIQEYMDDIGLIKDRKINLRIYLLIEIYRGRVYFYWHENGKCLYTRDKYNKEDINDYYGNITSYGEEYGDLNEFYEEYPHSFTDLIQYINTYMNSEERLINRKRINLEKKMDKVMRRIKAGLKYHLENVLEDNLSVGKRRQFQLFGLDFIFRGENWDPILLEINKGPDMNYKCDKDIELKRCVYEDMFRTVGFIPELIPSKFKKI
jgi:hypothetical protein